MSLLYNICYLFFDTHLQIMAAVSFGVLFTCGLVYETPPEKDPSEEENEEEEDEEDIESLNEEDEEKLLEEEVFYHDTIWKNKPLIIFLLSTYMLNFGYYVPYVHLVSLRPHVTVPYCSEMK